MKIKLTLTALLFTMFISCKKHTDEISVIQPPIKFSKIESFFTPYKNGQPITSETFIFSNKTFDENGNLTSSLHRFLRYSDFDLRTNTLIRTTYKYDNGRLIEKDALELNSQLFDIDNKFTYSYTNNGDTAEINRYDNKTGQLQNRKGYIYGSNGKKSRIIDYRVSDDEYGVAGSEFYSEFYKYDNNKNIIECAVIIPNIPNAINYTKTYTYNSKNDLLTASSTYSVTPYFEAKYTYNEKGLITEYIEISYSGSLKPNSTNRFVNTYQDGLLSKQTLYKKYNTEYYLAGVFEYVYTK